MAAQRPPRAAPPGAGGAEGPRGGEAGAARGGGAGGRRAGARSAEGDLAGALAGVWGGDGGAGALQGVARAVAAAPGLAGAPLGPKGRGALHAFAAGLDEGHPERERLLTALLGLGADPGLRDADGWAPVDSPGVSALQVRWREWTAGYAAPRPPLRLLLEGTRQLGRRQVLQALWLAMARADVGEAFDVWGFGRGQTPLHLVCRCLQGEPGASKASVMLPPGVPDRIPELAARRKKWGARVALLRLRAEAEGADSADGTEEVEPWTDAHELLTLVLDLGADCGTMDTDGRRPEDLCPFPTVRRLLRSDWDLGDESRDAFTVTPEGDVVDTRTGAVVAEGLTEEETADTNGLEAALADLCASMSGAGLGEGGAAKKCRTVRLVSSILAEEESFYARRGRAEAELRTWRQRNAAMREDFAAWPREDARRRLELFAASLAPQLGVLERQASHEQPPANARAADEVRERDGASEQEEEVEQARVSEGTEGAETHRRQDRPEPVFEQGYEYELDYA